MPPDTITLIRHGQSEVNVDKSICRTKPDYAARLTPLGRGQAIYAGLKLKALYADEPIFFWYSPFWRSRDTFLQIAEHVNVYRSFEDPRIREQEWSTSFDELPPDLDERRDGYGHFYYRMHSGEACADVYDRVSDFIQTLHRDFQDPDYPRHMAIVGHGMLNRVFLARWFHYTPEQFEILKNPANCGMYHMVRQSNGKYRLTEEPEKYPSYNHPFQYPQLDELEKYKKKRNQ